MPAISLTTFGSAYTQNFDTLSNTAGSTTNNLTINGWVLSEAGSGARDNEQYAVDTGGSNTGDTFSYGAAGSTDRALGSLQSGTLIPTYGAEFTNNTGATITSLDIAYVGEQWRLGTAGRTDQLNFEISYNATAVNDAAATWTNIGALNFVTPDTTGTAGARDGNAAGFRTALSATISSLSIANGATFWIRWIDVNASSADDGLALDDFSLTPQGGSALPVLNVNDVSQAEGETGTTVFTFTVSLSAPAGAGGVTFDIATADGTAQDDNPATEDNDYVGQVLTSQTIPEGSSTYTFSITVNSDTVAELNETFFVNVTNIVGANAGDVQGLGTIQTDDNPGSVSITDVIVSEAADSVTLVLTRSGGTSAFTVDYATAADSAGDGSDFVGEAGQVSFANGATTATVTIDLIGDTLSEGNEGFLINLTGTSGGASIADSSAAVTVVDDEPITLAAFNVAYTQNFDTLANFGSSTTNVMPIAGWFISETGGGARDNELYAVDNGASTSGDVYSYGATASSDRALGALASGSTVGTFGAAFLNDTGFTLSSLQVSFFAEQWRIGDVGGANDQLDFEISLDATSLTTGNWTSVNQLDIVTLNSTTLGASDGNVIRANLAYEIGGLSISDGATFWIRWRDTNITGNDDGLALDDFSITPKINPGISIGDVTAVEGNAGTVTYTFTVAIDQPAGPGGVTFDIATADGSATAASGDYVAKALTGQVIPEGQQFYTFEVTVNGDTFGEYHEQFLVNITNVVGTTIGDGQALGTIRNDDAVPIHIVQGPGHTSPFVGETVTTQGIVTARDNNGFWIQTPDADVDADLRTSEAIFVFTGTAPPVEAAIGNLLSVTALVTEFVGGAGALAVTELTNAVLTVVSTGNALPAATLIGAGGRVVPNAVYDDDNFSSFDIATDALDFYESLEGMRVTIETPRAVSDTTSFGETYVVASNGAGATGINPRGGITISPGDMNPERIQIDADPDLFGGYAPNHTIGDTLGNVTGILNYAFSSYEVLVTQAVTVTNDVSLGFEETALAGGAGTLTIGSYNVENLDPGDSAAKLQQHALDIVDGMGSPDIIGLQEIQDGNGVNGSPPLSGAESAQALINAIVAAGGPTYVYVEVAPATENSTGGEPGGNIRNGYLYNPDRVSYVPNSAVLITGPAYTNSTRKPLVADFVFLGETVTVVDLHLTSRIGSDPLFGADQPPENAGDAARLAQAQGVRDYLDARFGNAVGDNVVVLGDLNSFYFEAPSDAIEAGGFYTNLYETLALNERYSAIFEGNLQGLDNIIVSSSLMPGVLFDAVHRNSEQPEAANRSDHDPVVAAIRIDAIPIALADAYKVSEDGSLAGGSVLANDSDADDFSLTAVLVDGPDHAASFVLNADGTFAYVPAADFNGFDSFSYKPNDGQLDGNVVTVQIEVLAVNDAPVAIGESYNVVEDTPLVIPATGVLGNDDDVDGDTLTASLVSGPAHALSFTLNADGSFSYTPAADYFGPDSFSYRPYDGLVFGNIVTVTLNVIAANDAAIARNDAFQTLESDAVAGNLFADNGSGADSDPDGPLAIAAVNGSAAAVGQQIVLPSGALLTVNADGTFSYDPNGAFNRLTIAATGASNLSAPDVFTYSLAGGGTATVQLTINGERSLDDWLVGSAGHDIVSDAGFNYNDSFFLQQGGNDAALGEGGNDGFYFGAQATTMDSVDGGAGIDSVALQGNYPILVLGNVQRVENLVLLPGNDTRFGDLAGNSYDYNIATSDGNVAAGAILTVIGANLRPGEDLVFNGGAEQDGAFRIFAGRGVDVLSGGNGNDGFLFGAEGNFTGADAILGGFGVDAVALRGNYVGATAVVMQAGTLSSVEVMTMLSGFTTEFGGLLDTNGFDYDVTLADGNVVAGGRLDIVAGNLRLEESLRLDGRAETDGILRIISGAGDDTLYGGAGADFLYGGLGADRLEGGAGNDLYVYRSTAESTAAKTDTIAGFAAGDRIDLSLIDANGAAAGEGAFAFIGAGAFTGVAGQLRYSQSGADAVLEGDVNGDGLADLVVLIQNWTPVAGDFIL